MPTPTKADKFDAVIDQLSDLPIGDPDVTSIKSTVLLARLKGLNRDANAATRAAKNETAAVRQDLEKEHLGFQNSQYEKRHLEREIEKCRQFSTIYQDVATHSMEEFLRLAPPEARGDEVLADEHQLLLNRLSFEFVERQRLDLRMKQLIAEKDAMLKTTKQYAVIKESIAASVDTVHKAGIEAKKALDKRAEEASELTPSVPTISESKPATDDV
ncbi:THO complex subunit 5 [Mycena kentingensis (nom. inval.)]|nr:THO complex subunit 5 [Mycena kentingensis (nom. inval.)]